MLSGCGTSDNTDVKVIDTVSETTSVSETKITSETTAESSETETVSETAAEEIAVIEETAIVEEPVETTSKYTEDAPVHKYVLEEIDLSMFPMNTDEFYDFQIKEINNIRAEIKTMLDCSKTGEIPDIEVKEYNYIYGRQLKYAKVESWSVKEETYDVDLSIHKMVITLEISESESEFLPVGTNDYMFVYAPDGVSRSYWQLRTADAYDEESIVPCYDEDREYLDFCNDFTAYLSDCYSGDVVTDFSSPVISEDSWGVGFSAHLMAYRYYPDFIEPMTPYSHFDDAMHNMFGFSADALHIKDNGVYNAEDDTVELIGKGWYWHWGEVAEDIYDEASSTHTVTLNYYADDFHLDLSQVYRYTIRENENGSYTMLKMERLFTSDKDIIGGSV